MNNEFIQALDVISKDKGIDKELLIEAVEVSLTTACRKNFGANQNVKVVVDRETGVVQVFVIKDIVEEVEDESLQISLEDAKAINPNYELGEVVSEEVTPKDFGRVAAQTAKQVVMQRIREAEREIIYNEYLSKEDDIVTGIVQRVTPTNVYVNFGRVEAMMPLSEQVKTETYEMNKRVKVYVTEVKQTNKGPQVFVSRTHPNLVKRLFEQEVPEIFDGVIEIINISRDPGSRTKLSIKTNNDNVDPLGACVGQNGQRVNAIVNELKGEKIDIVIWNNDIRYYIKEALNPSQVLAVEINEEEKIARVVVPENQLSLAIGKKGQNVRLAAKLTGWKIDIRDDKKAVEENFITNEESYF